MKPLIKVVINTKKLKDKIKYDGWFETRNYFESFIEDCLLNIKVAWDNGGIVDDLLELDDSKRL